MNIKCNIFPFSDLGSPFVIDTGVSLPYDELTFVLTVAISLPNCSL